MNVIYRRLDQEDLSLLHSFLLATNLPVRPRGRESQEALKRQLSDPRTAFWGAFVGNEMIGVVLATSDGRKGWINRLYIQEPYRQKGIARELIRRGESFLLSQGLRIIAALIERENTPSLQLFQSVGYELVEDIVYLRKTFQDGA